MRSRRFRVIVPAVLVLSLVGASLAIAASKKDKHHNEQNQFKAVLIGHNEVPAVHTAASGRLLLTINADNTMSYELTYSGLSTTPPLFAHIHFAQPNVNGAVSFFLCGGAPPASNKPPCPASTSTPVTGTISAADVANVTSQGLVPAGNIGAIIDEIRAGFAYANVHTTQSPGGEIRGQLDEARGHGGGHHDDDDDDD